MQKDGYVESGVTNNIQIYIARYTLKEDRKLVQNETAWKEADKGHETSVEPVDDILLLIVIKVANEFTFKDWRTGKMFTLYDREHFRIDVRFRPIQNSQMLVVRSIENLK